jgi:hypothetical protein
MARNWASRLCIGVPDLVDDVREDPFEGDTLLATGEGSGVDDVDFISSNVGEPCNFRLLNKVCLVVIFV